MQGLRQAIAACLWKTVNAKDALFLGISHSSRLAIHAELGQLQLSCTFWSRVCHVWYVLYKIFVAPLCSCHNESQLGGWPLLGPAHRQVYMDRAWGLRPTRQACFRRLLCASWSGLPGKLQVAGCKVYPCQYASPVHTLRIRCAYTAVEFSLTVALCRQYLMPLSPMSPSAGLA